MIRNIPELLSSPLTDDELRGALVWRREKAERALVELRAQREQLRSPAKRQAAP